MALIGVMDGVATTVGVAIMDGPAIGLRQAMVGAIMTASTTATTAIDTTITDMAAIPMAIMVGATMAIRLEVPKSIEVATPIRDLATKIVLKQVPTEDLIIEAAMTTPDPA